MPYARPTSAYPFWTRAMRSTEVVGCWVGNCVGFGTGNLDGLALGSGEGIVVGDGVGVTVGRSKPTGCPCQYIWPLTCRVVTFSTSVVTEDLSILVDWELDSPSILNNARLFAGALCSVVCSALAAASGRFWGRVRGGSAPSSSPARSSWPSLPPASAPPSQ